MLGTSGAPSDDTTAVMVVSKAKVGNSLRCCPPWFSNGLLVRLARLGGGLRPRVGVEDDLADPDRVGGDLDALVVAAELQALLQRQLARRDQLLEVVGGGGPDVGLLLLLGDVDVHVVRAGVLADDHALVNLRARLDE